VDDVYAALLLERFGPLADLERERLARPAPREVARRRRVLAQGMREASCR
jgi:hypothetical protein